MADRSTDNTAAENDSRSTSTLLTDAIDHMRSLVRNEVDLARTEMQENMNKATTAIGMLVGAAVLAIVALTVLAAAVVAALVAWGLSTGWASAIVGGVLLVIALIMMSKGRNDLKTSSLAPTRTARNVREDTKTLKESYDAR